MKMTIRRLGMVLSLLSGAACAHASLQPTFGTMYNDVFTAQQADRSAKDVWGFRGVEAQRAVNAYYDTLGPEEASGSSGGPSPSGSSKSGPATTQNPFSAKTSR